MDFDNDKNLVEKAKADRQAFASLYQKYSEKVFNYFWYRLNHDTEVAQDLMQDVFLNSFNNLHKFREEGYSYLTYLLKIAHNLLIDYYKKPKDLSLEDLSQDITDDAPEEITQNFEDSQKEKPPNVLQPDSINRLWINLMALYEEGEDSFSFFDDVGRRQFMRHFYRKELVPDGAEAEDLEGTLRQLHWEMRYNFLFMNALVVVRS